MVHVSVHLHSPCYCTHLATVFEDIDDVYAGALGFPVDRKSMVWKDTHWRIRGFREYPWTLSSMKARL